jgi:hypothetical protein
MPHMNEISKIWILLTLALSCGQSIACEKDTPLISEMQKSGKHHVSGPFSIGQLEQEHRIHFGDDPFLSPEHSNKLDHFNKEWNQLKSEYKDGDQFFFVEYEEGMLLLGRYVLVRQDCVIDGFIYYMSNEVDVEY